jgi:hypothetical protein
MSDPPKKESSPSREGGKPSKVFTRKYTEADYHKPPDRDDNPPPPSPPANEKSDKN